MDMTLLDERPAIKAAIDAWITLVEREDLSQMDQVVSTDPGSVWIGAGAREWLPGYDALEAAMQAQNDALEKIHIDVSEESIHIAPCGVCAWATNQWVFNALIGEQRLAAPLRCSWILEKRQDRWLIVHFHKSAGLPA